ncbi:MAG: hypothetical protein V1847_01280 [Candidatus Diapherotrites archaeon]
MKKSDAEFERIHREWIGEIAKAMSNRAIQRHINRHAKEIFEDDPLGWSVSMLNLTEIYMAKHKVKHSLHHKIDRLAMKYRYYPKVRTKLPKNFDIKQWKCLPESEMGQYIEIKAKKRKARKKARRV